MDRSLSQRILTKISLAILAVALIDLAFLNWWIIKDQRSRINNQAEGPPQSRVAERVDQPSPLATATPLATVEPKAETKTFETKTIVEKETQTIVQTAQKEIFIPIGSGSTKNNNYEDLAGLEVSIDTNKYSSIDSVTFEASIWVQDGNGKMFAQLYNVSDKHPVWNSEISTFQASGLLITSPKIVLDSGNKTYRVQAKTNLTAFAAHVDNARIKITLK